MHKQKKTFKVKRIALAVSLATASAAGVQLAHAGAGWAVNAGGQPAAVQTFYANSPSGLRPNPKWNGVSKADQFIDTGKPLRKFVDALPGLCAGGPIPAVTRNPSGTGLDGKCIPVAVADTKTYPDADYYEIGVVEYSELMHSDLANPTTLRGYVQLNDPANPITRDANGNPTSWPQPHYLGPVIVASADRPVRVKYYNLLPKGSATLDANGKVVARNGDLFIPVDETLPGAGYGPDGYNKFTQNRTSLHLHGTDAPWVNDGTAHQWFTPAGENTPYQVGESWSSVPDMTIPAKGDGVQTAYYPNGLSARLMFYHDHASSITRLNVYAGMAAGYLVTDPAEATLMNGGTLTRTDGTTINVAPGTLPGIGIPLVIQDKTFVPNDINKVDSTGTAVGQDEKWDQAAWGKPGDLWFPHVYETNQDPSSADGTNPSGRWDWGPWFWPIFPAANALPSGNYGDASTTPEAFMDTPVVNGVAYPTLTLDPKAYRFRVLNATNDRYLNLGFYEAVRVLKSCTVTGSDGGFDPLTTTVSFSGGLDARIPNAIHATATANVDIDGSITGIPGAVASVTLTGFGTAYTSIPSIIIKDAAGKTAQATCTLSDLTEVAMVPFDASAKAPTTGGLMGSGWGTPDNRVGGVPSPVTVGPDILQLGSEGGILPKLVTIPSTPTNFEYNKRSVTVLNVLEHGLWMGGAERADVVVDFSAYAGKTLILYNDMAAPVPAGDPRVDYYTGDPDQSDFGGHRMTQPGYGPNIRTIMQIKVNAGAPQPFNKAALEAALPAAYAASQKAPIVGESAYNDAFPTAGYSDNYATIYTGSASQPNFIWNDPGLQTVSSIAITDPGTNYVAGKVTATVSGGGGATVQIPSANITVSGSKVVSIDLAGVAFGDYTSQPTITINGNGAGHGATGRVMTSGSHSMPIQTKTIQELFEPNYGRMNSTLGVELPFTSQYVQTTIPLNFVDPTTEVLSEGETQIWKITHNGVDSHPMHFHFVNVQVLNRIGWDGTVKPPHPGELGWKETVKMNPLEDIVVAVRAKAPKLPFGVPNSRRHRDPSQADGAISGFTQIDPITGNAPVNPVTGAVITVNNQMDDFGWEYTWHCHILGHEENDMMRAVVFKFPAEVPAQPTNVAFANGTVSWTDATPGWDPLLNAGRGGVPEATLTSRANEVGFLVERSDDGGNVWAPVGNLLPDRKYNVIANRTSIVDPNAATATPDTMYRVTAIGASVNSAAGIYQANAGTVPADPTGLAATVAAFDQAPGITLAWTDNATNETGYTLSRSADGGAYVTVATLPAHIGTGATSYVDTLNLAPGVTYAYQLVARNNAGTSAVAATTAAVTPAWTAPAAPTAISGTSINSTEVIVTWTDNSTNEGGFALERSLAGMNSWITVATLPANTVKYTDLAVQPNTAYEYRIKAFNAMGSSAYVTSGNVVTPLAPTLTPPSNLVAQLLSTTQASLSWTDAAIGETAFHIQTSTNGTTWVDVTPNVVSTDSAGTGTQMQTTINVAVAARTPLMIRIAPVQGTTIGAYSPMVTIDPMANVSKPQALVAKPDGFGGVTLSWSDVSNANTGYQITYMYNGAKVVAAPPVMLDGKATTYTYSGLPVGSYHFYVNGVFVDTATKTVTKSQPAEIVTTVTDLTPAAPTVVDAVATQIDAFNDSITLNWNDVATTETAYEIQRSVDPTFATVQQTLTAPAAAGGVVSFTDTPVTRGLFARITYYYRVRAVTTFGGKTVGSAWVAWPAVTAQ